MINTFHTSYNPPPVPPPVPPRAGFSRTPSPSNTPLVKFLSVMLLLLMMLTFGGFLYLFQKLNVVSPPASEHAAMTAPRPSFNGPAAHMVLQVNQEGLKYGRLSNKQLFWDRQHSLLRGVSLSNTRDTLTIQYPGIYFIYSQVTFSKYSTSSLKQAIWSKGTKNQEKYKELLRSYCSLDPDKQGLCTTSLSGVFHLQQHEELYVTVTNTSLVNKDSCSFGLFKLQND